MQVIDNADKAADGLRYLGSENFLMVNLLEAKAEPAVVVVRPCTCSSNDHPNFTLFLDTKTRNLRHAHSEKKCADAACV